MTLQQSSWTEQDAREAGLAQAEDELARANAELARAEAELMRAIVRDRAAAGADAAIPVASVDTVRVRCRLARSRLLGARLRHDRLRAELAELMRVQATGNYGRETGASIKVGATDPELGAAARRPDPDPSLHKTQSSRRQVSDAKSHRANASSGSRINGSSALGRCEKPAAGHAPARQYPVIQIVQLLALVLAYLQFYFLDVQLEIEHLPKLIIALLDLG